MMFSDEDRKKYSSGPLINNSALKGKIIRVERLDVGTADRINERVSRTAGQHRAEAQRAMEIATETYSD